MPVRSYTQDTNALGISPVEAPQSWGNSLPGGLWRLVLTQAPRKQHLREKLSRFRLDRIWGFPGVSSLLFTFLCWEIDSKSQVKTKQSYLGTRGQMSERAVLQTEHGCLYSPGAAEWRGEGFLPSFSLPTGDCSDCECPGSSSLWTSCRKS